MGRTEVALVAGAVVGGALWLLGPMISGQPMAWDGGLRYLAALAVAGAALETIAPGKVWPGPAGLYVGQAVAVLVPIILVRGRQILEHSTFEPNVIGGTRAPWPVGFQLLFLSSITLSALLGSATVAGLRLWWRGELGPVPAPEPRPPVEVEVVKPQSKRR
jgi:hypothetical protein